MVLFADAVVCFCCSLRLVLILFLSLKLLLLLFLCCVSVGNINRKVWPPGVLVSNFIVCCQLQLLLCNVAVCWCFVFLVLAVAGLVEEEQTERQFTDFVEGFESQGSFRECALSFFCWRAGTMTRR